MISRLLYSHAPNIGGMNVDVQSDLSTLALNNREQLKGFNSRIIRLQQEIYYLEKLHLLQDFYASTLSHCQRAKNKSIHYAQDDIHHKINRK